MLLLAIRMLMPLFFAAMPRHDMSLLMMLRHYAAAAIALPLRHTLTPLPLLIAAAEPSPRCAPRVAGADFRHTRRFTL